MYYLVWPCDAYDVYSSLEEALKYKACYKNWFGIETRVCSFNNSELINHN